MFHTVEFIIFRFYVFKKIMNDAINIFTKAFSSRFCLIFLMRGKNNFFKIIKYMINQMVMSPFYIILCVDHFMY